MAKDPPKRWAGVRPWMNRAALAVVVTAAAIAGTGLGGPVVARSDQPVGFNAAIRPILVTKCFRCHGGVREQAGLNLIDRQRATAPREKGRTAVVPGHPEASELIHRVSATGKERMPPEGEPLAQAEIDALRRWISEGAHYEQHWSFTSPGPAALPAVKDAAWIRSPLDRFVLVGLERAGLAPPPEADRATLLRRASLDLTGLPPTPEELDAFLADGSPQAFEKVVDRLLASPRFGERWARIWLDLARYADTQGYEKDERRTIWAWRDWLIEALDRDMPYDEFVVRLLAGDLLPKATDDDRIASAFHRNTLTNVEGGTDDEEFRMAAVFDRVSVTWQAFMGTTFQCVQCHGHPYDEFSHREYYEFLAFFNQTADNDQPDERPTLALRPPFWRERATAAASRLAGAGFDEGTFEDWLDRATREPERSGLDDDLKAILAKGSGAREPAETALLKLASKREDPRWARELAVLAPTTVPVMRELPADQARATHILERGSLSKPGSLVQPRTPAALPPFPADEPRNRLGLARWLTTPGHPLFGRVGVNRLWQTLFGRGIVETSEDFGSLGSPPTDRALLDHLALRYAELGWSTKALLREIVLSSTYRQSAVASAETLAKDPGNLLWSRAPRYRLEAEAIRDSVLFVSGLLSERRFGPSVMPPQPDGVWQIVYSSDAWKTSEGEDAYRRAIYTFWRRSSPYPSMIVFDAPSRETCSVRRITSDSPLAALVGLNDPVWMEAAAALARRTVVGGGPPNAIAARMIRTALVREPLPEESARLVALWSAERERLESDSSATAALVGGDDPTLAAWAVVASVVLNLDEFLSRK